MGETKAGGAAAPTNSRSAANPLTFASVTQWQAAPGRARALGVDLSSSPLREAADFLTAPLPTLDANAALGWAGQAMENTRTLADAIEGAIGAAVAEKTELDVAVLRQTLLTNPQSQTRAALQSLKAGRFNTERAEWKRRLDTIFLTIRDKQERAVDRLEIAREDRPGDRVAVRASDAYWGAYLRWQQGILQHLRAQLSGLLHQRWLEFAQEHADELGSTLECRIEVTMPSVAIDDLPDPFAARRPSERDHYRAGAERLSAADGIDGSMEPPSLEYARTSLAQAVGEAYRKKFGWARAVGGVAGHAVAIPLLGVAALRGKEDAARLNQEAEQKLVEMLKKQLLDDFRKRLDRHRVEVDRFVHQYAALAQQAVVRQLSERVNTELARRQEQYSEAARNYSIKQQQLQARITALQAINTLLLSNALVELEARQRALLQQVMAAMG